MPADNVIQLPTQSPRTDASTVRLAVERMQGMQLIGWALDPATPGRERITLRCGAALLEAPLRRKPRADVRQALDVAAEALGFELDLPVSVWRAMAESGGELQVLVNDVAAQQPRVRPTLKGLSDWMDRISRHADPAQREALLAPLRPHLEQARLWPASPGALAETTEMPAPCHLEGWLGLSLSGWVADTPRQREPIRLRCGDRLLDCPVLRVSRRDVAHAMLLEHEDIGFVLEVPGTIWQQAGSSEELSLQVVVGQRACGAPLSLRRDQLSDRLDQALALTDPGRRSHQGLLAMEHLVLAGELGGLDHALRSALQVSRCGSARRRTSGWRRTGRPTQAPPPPRNVSRCGWARAGGSGAGWAVPRGPRQRCGCWASCAASPGSRARPKRWS